MNFKKRIIIFVFITQCFMGFVFAETESLYEKYEELDVTAPVKKIVNYDYYVALSYLDISDVSYFLETGSNPNKCVGEMMWADSNPLKVVIEEHFYSYDFNKKAKKTIDVFPDIEIIKLLVQYGADVNRLPYIWERVYRDDNISLEYFTKGKNEEDAKIITCCYIEDSNRVIKTLLESGANPDMKGHPAPFENTWKVLFFTDKKAYKYFNSKKASSPIYEAIKKGIQWESQVDLLLEYGASLDSSCLEAARLSGDELMIKKIENLLESSE